MSSRRFDATGRRRFLQTTAAIAVGNGFSLCSHLQAESEGKSLEDLPQWRPCIDVGSGNASPNADAWEEHAPVRTSEADLLTPVDLAIVEQHPNVAQAVSKLPNMAVAMADKLLATTKQVEETGLPVSSPSRMAVKSRWSKSELLVYFYHGAAQLRKRVLDIANEWSNHAKITFRDTTQRNGSDIRIAFQGTGHWSYVGTDNINVPGQTMNLEMTEPPKKGEYNYGVVLHEFGHALGCIHEHQSPKATGFFNEQAVLRYYRDRYGWNETKTRLNVLNRYNESQLLRGYISDFDTSSIMIYSYPKELTRNQQGTPVNVTLSPTDIAYIGKLYGVSSTQPTVTPPTDGPRGTLVEGKPATGSLSPSNQVSRFDFEITAPGTYTVVSNGTTQLSMKLFRDASELQMRVTTPDLVNQVASPELAAGKYRLEIRPRLEGAVGDFVVELLKGKR